MWGRQEWLRVHQRSKKMHGRNGKGNRERGGIRHMAVPGSVLEGAQTQEGEKTYKCLKNENRKECFYPRSGRLNQVKLAEIAS